MGCCAGGKKVRNRKAYSKGSRTKVLRSGKRRLRRKAGSR